MSVAASDLIYPVGEIEEEWFAPEDVGANLTLWIGQATVPDAATPEQADAITAAFAYVRAYDAKLMKLAATPDSANVDDLSATVKDSRVWFRAKRDAWQARLDAAVLAVGDDTGEEQVTSPPLASGSLYYVARF